MNSERLNTDSLSDSDNPRFIFSMTSTKLLLDILNDGINPLYLARKELINRGIGTSGTWVGFEQAEKEWEGKT